MPVKSFTAPPPPIEPPASRINLRGPCARRIAPVAGGRPIVMCFSQHFRRPDWHRPWSGEMNTVQIGWGLAAVLTLMTAITALLVGRSGLGPGRDVLVAAVRAV